MAVEEVKTALKGVTASLETERDNLAKLGRVKDDLAADLAAAKANNAKV